MQSPQWLGLHLGIKTVNVTDICSGKKSGRIRAPSNALHFFASTNVVSSRNALLFSNSHVVHATGGIVTTCQQNRSVAAVGNFIKPLRRRNMLSAVERVQRPGNLAAGQIP
ncbi:hypothetical protein OGAPHI_006968 [Ogataea philodendri]|uniref:Uncharacterized protein n=1 Tax=Ogataea philodendri TaxID=1378263 RepID=A0A9P8NVV7_9ASCO|nr:uncharacterized protein OGAPHI_006968 [Ogataea philodendri]KAH3660382.1 hypothetical protein OGAPHI_006968 [Ogataea philodendri]